MTRRAPSPVQGQFRRPAAPPGYLYAMRRFEIGPLLVAIGAIVLLVSLFLTWYADLTAWEAFELSDLLLAVLALVALVAAAGFVAPELAYLDRPWLPVSVLAIAVVVAAQILSPPPAAGGADPETGAWIAFGAALLMLTGAVLSVSHVSFSMAVEGREPRQRVAAVDHRPPTTEAGAVVSDNGPGAAETEATVAQDDSETGTRRRRGSRGS
jgi:hypothetical protein